MGSGFNNWVNTWDEFLIEVIEKIKKRWLKKDKQKLKELEKKYEETNKQCQDAYDKYLSLNNKVYNLSNSIDRLKEKYTYTKKIKVKNKHYIEPSY